MRWPVRVACAALFALVWLPARPSTSQPASGRRVPPPAPYVFALTNDGPTRFVGEEVMGPARAGRYFVLDFTGLYAEARLVRSRELRSSSVTGANVPHQYELAIVGRASRAWQRDGHVVGVGPLRSPPVRGRLMAAGLALAGTAVGTITVDPLGTAPPNGYREDELEYAVDLDGDRAADLVTHGVERDGGNTRTSFRRLHRREMWSRASGVWARTAQSEWESVGTIGP